MFVSHTYRVIYTRSGCKQALSFAGKNVGFAYAQLDRGNRRDRKAPISSALCETFGAGTNVKRADALSKLITSLARTEFFASKLRQERPCCKGVQNSLGRSFNPWSFAIDGVGRKRAVAVRSRPRRRFGESIGRASRHGLVSACREQRLEPTASVVVSFLGHARRFWGGDDRLGDEAFQSFLQRWLTARHCQQGTFPTSRGTLRNGTVEKPGLPMPGEAGLFELSSCEV